MVKSCLAALLVFPLVALACDYPDEGNMPLRRAVTKVKLLPQAAEARAEGATWRRFYVTPDGMRVLSEDGLQEAKARRKATGSAAARAAAR